ncbi:uncharacterized protein TrAFT101_003464 [Trichoderma asperellum]|uniref:uncharacterized protein n=1 Tax=Trichoderma asperellum TaxID=101201 RepID=UPI00331DB6F6|nr:hypothetical protein TrAFT101_003464 [Trichoderma asperellum]
MGSCCQGVPARQDIDIDTDIETDPLLPRKCSADDDSRLDSSRETETQRALAREEEEQKGRDGQGRGKTNRQTAETNTVILHAAQCRARPEYLATSQTGRNPYCMLR